MTKCEENVSVSSSGAIEAWMTRAPFQRLLGNKEHYYGRFRVVRPWDQEMGAAWGDVINGTKTTSVIVNLSANVGSSVVITE